MMHPKNLRSKFIVPLRLQEIKKPEQEIAQVKKSWYKMEVLLRQGYGRNFQLDFGRSVIWDEMENRHGK